MTPIPLATNEQVNAVEYSLAEAAHLVSGSSDFTVRLWDAVAGKELKILTTHTDKVRWRFEGSAKFQL